MKERDMQQSVHKWLRGIGATNVIYEFLMGVGYCDMIGIQFARRVGRPIPALLNSVAVELKLTDVAGVIKQARGNLRFVNSSYAAMPCERCARMTLRTKLKFSRAEVGLLSVGSDVLVVVEPLESRDPLQEEALRKKWWTRTVRDKRRRKDSP